MTLQQAKSVGKKAETIEKMGIKNCLFSHFYNRDKYNKKDFWQKVEHLKPGLKALNSQADQ